MRPTDIVSAFAPGLIASGLEWMVTGGVAAIVYGEPRLTQDLDVVLNSDPSRAAALAAQFPRDRFYCPPVEAIAEEASRDAAGHFNLLHLETDSRADVYLAGRDALMLRGLKERRQLEIAGLQVPVAPPEYVVLQKLRYRQQGAGDRHLRDVRAMLRVLGDSIDVRKLEADADALGLAEEWRRMSDG